MKISKIINKALAGFMLLVFTISVTPKKYFHDLFSCHTDYTSNTTQPGKQQLAAYQFSCGFVNTVAVTPFTPEGPVEINYHPGFLHPLPVAVSADRPTQVLFSCFSHRGPPAA